MRFDHIVIHTDNDQNKLQAFKNEANGSGYPFDLKKGRRGIDFRVNHINVGDEYLEIVQITRPNAQTWMPLWTHYYDQGERGAYCIFIEVEDVERTAVAIKKSGLNARGPAVLPDPHLFGLLRFESPYFIYYMPPFPGSTLHLALMQYKKPEGRLADQARRGANALENGIQGIRRVEIDLPNYEESLPMLQKIFGSELRDSGRECAIQMKKTRMCFRPSPSGETQVHLLAIASRRERLGGRFKLHNVEVSTSGG